MPKGKAQNLNPKQLTVENLRHAEYYGMQGIFDDLYARSLKGETFTGLMSDILSRENILLAYRNIKANSGSKTPGTDKVTIEDIGRLSPDEVVNKIRYIVKDGSQGYRPKPVRRKDIPKPNGKTRPLGIPCMWDRLIQQCIKQIMEPICEAKFSDNSYGFRPNRSAEHAISKTYKLMQISNLHYVVEVDIEGFFDNVNHSKLIRQLWAMGIQDKQLIWVIKQILKAPIRMPDGSTSYPTKGTPQGGIISPLLANVVLNELDHWVESQWQENPVSNKRKNGVNKSGSPNKSNGYKLMKSTGLKEMFIVRYADDFRIFCRTKTEAEKVCIAVTQWLKERLKLIVSPEKTRVVNTKRKYSEFLGFKIKMHMQKKKYAVKSHICDKAKQTQKGKLKEQAKKIGSPGFGRTVRDEVSRFNAMVMGMHNYYQIATCINIDCQEIGREVNIALKNRLHGTRLTKKPRGKESNASLNGYGKSNQLRYVNGVHEPIFPIAYVKHKNPIAKKRSACGYTKEGRMGLHDNLCINTKLMLELMRQPQHGQTVEYADNRISLFSAQWGKCAVTGTEVQTVEDIHCHHITTRKNGGTDAYENLVLVSEPVHKLIHVTDPKAIAKYLKMLNLTTEQLAKLNKFREETGNAEIA